MNKFETFALNKQIIKALDFAKIINPTPIQNKIIPLIINKCTPLINEFSPLTYNCLKINCLPLLIKSLPLLINILPLNQSNQNCDKYKYG